MPSLVTIVPFTALTQDRAAWAFSLWLVLLLLPLIVLVLGRTNRRRRMPVARRTRRLPCRRTLFRWPTRFPVVLLVMGARQPLRIPAVPARERGRAPAESRRLEAMVFDISGGRSVY